MYLLIGMIPLAIGVVLLVCAGKKRKQVRRAAIAMMVLGVLLIAASLSLLSLVLSGRVTLPLE